MAMPSKLMFAVSNCVYLPCTFFEDQGQMPMVFNHGREELRLPCTILSN